jgi:DNA-binding MarR family transcriptional regulator
VNAWAAVPYWDRWITPGSPLTEQEVRVLDVLHQRADCYGRVQMGYGRLADCAGVTKSDAHRAARALCARQAIRSTRLPEDRAVTRWRVLETVDSMAARVGLEPGVRI